MLKTLSNIKKNLSANTVAVIDIGDIRTFCLIYRVYDNNNYKLLSIESIFTSGFERGVVVDLEKAIKCLSELLNKSEKIAKARIVDVIISAPKEKTTIFTYPYVKRINKQVSRQDLNKLKDINEYSPILSTGEIIIGLQHSDIFLDGKKVNNPVGMYASKLTTDITIIKCVEAYIVNLLNLFEHLSINLVSIVHTSMSLPYLLNVGKPSFALFIQVEANNTSITIANKSKITFYKEINRGINYIINTALKNLGVNFNILEEKEIYDMSFANFKGKIIKFISKGRAINVLADNINNELDKVISSFFKLIMLELKHVDMNDIINVSIIGECSNLIELNTMFSKQMNSNIMLIDKLKKENIVLSKPLESVATLSIIKYYLENYKIDSTLKVLSKKLKDLLY